MPVVKQDTHVQNTFVVDTICSWLSGRPSYAPEGVIDDTQSMSENILHQLGYSEPYTPEQRAINAMLLIKRADEFTCQVAWEFYNEYHNAPSEHSRFIAA